jgi:hypothetical protein
MTFGRNNSLNFALSFPGCSVLDTKYGVKKQAPFNLAASILEIFSFRNGMVEGMNRK